MQAVSQATDTDLIENALDGDRAAFGDLVRRYQDRLYNNLLHFCGAREDAQDVAQDAFVAAYTKLATFQRQSAFYTWLYRIALNLLATRRRRARLALSLDQCHQRGHEPVDGHLRPAALVESRDRVSQVRTALLALADEHRQVIVLREMEGWSYETIAESLDVPIGTVRSRLHRARAELRALLKSVHEEDLK